MSLRLLMTFAVAICFAPASNFNVAHAADDQPEVVIYGGTSAGIIAAVQLKKMGKSVVVIEPTDRIGGLTTGGLGQTDIGNKQAVGGLSRQFYRDVRTYYQDPANWKWQKKEEYRSGGQSQTAEEEDTMWTFEPSAALKILQGYVDEHDIRVEYNTSIDEVMIESDEDSGPVIKLVLASSGQIYEPKIVIDATYEGDLLPLAKVSFTVGREGIDKYDESFAGVQTEGPKAGNHNFVKGVDPYVTPGDPSSGLLPFVDPKGPGKEGSADHRVQAYCFRMCLTDHPENRIPFAKPEGYDEQWYELLFRNFEAGETRVPWINSAMPNRKTDTNNKQGFSTDFIGQNYQYPEGDAKTRQEIIERHRLYQKGLMWSLAYHPRIPKKIRDQVSRWGTCKDEFESEDGWQQQLYIREARRMIGAYVMTQHHCTGDAIVEDSVGLAAYGMDSHHMQRYVTPEGHVRNEGNIQAHVAGPYPISYKSLVPKRTECTNLLVPVCLSSSHIAFGSIRMEPVFMTLGQSAATAAAMAIDADVAVQDVDYKKLRERLVKDKQRLTGRNQKVVPVGSLKGIILDDVGLLGAGPEVHWIETESNSQRVGSAYFHDGNTHKNRLMAQFSTKEFEPGRFEVRVAYAPHSNRAQAVPIRIWDGENELAKLTLNQRKRPDIDGLFQRLGRYRFENEVIVQITNDDTNGYVVVDAVQLLPIDDKD
nr:FAD-dependent oxidoreductase [Stratiformator vulcanicus]